VGALVDGRTVGADEFNCDEGCVPSLGLPVLLLLLLSIVGEFDPLVEGGE